MKSVRRVVVKIGTAALSNELGGLDEAPVARLAEQVNLLRQRGLDVVIVTSGAIGAGVNALGLAARPTRLPELQACAAVGQGRLMSAYDRCFRKHGYHAAQMLLTRDDFDDRRRYLNASNALRAILAAGAVPLINENDTISVDEITFSDNDRLAALVAGMLDADLLILLTVVDGVYENPAAPAAERRVRGVIEEVNAEVSAFADASRTTGGKGGMKSKLDAAAMASAFGQCVVIAHAGGTRVLERICDGEAVGTLVLPARKRLDGHKRWLRYGTRPKGTLVVDAGAQRALVERGKSLLPSGITAVRGVFGRGDLVSICDEAGREMARGLVNYGAEDMARILGQKTAAIRKALGEASYEEAVHRDHLVVIP